MTDTFPCMPDFQEGTGVCRRCGAIAAPCPSDAQSAVQAVAWIDFADNGNIRFWTSDMERAQSEKERGRHLRMFTLAELVALAAKSSDGRTDEAKARESDQFVGALERAGAGDEPRTPRQAGVGSERSSPSETLQPVPEGVRVEGATDIVDEAACLIWSELCPGLIMQDEDRHYYEAAAKAVLALTAARDTEGKGETWDIRIFDRVQQLRAAGTESLTLDAVLGLIAFVRDGEGCATVSSTDQSKLVTSQDTGLVDVMISPSNGDKDPPPIWITIKQGLRIIARVEITAADFSASP